MCNDSKTLDAHCLSFVNCTVSSNLSLRLNSGSISKVTISSFFFAIKCKAFLTLKIYSNDILKFTYYSEYQDNNIFNSSNKNIILFVGRFIRSKGIYELIDICSKLKNDHILYLVVTDQKEKNLKIMLILKILIIKLLVG